MAKAKTEEFAEGAAQEDTSAAQALAAAPAAPQTIQARVLVHCNLGEPNDVVDIDAALAETMAGVVDTNASAVSYALSLQG